ncbi:MAG: putative lipid II flippase FtsW [Deltaproteobacteria bacterium]|nr:putative lipid II flippase FtsW [Deltaproteobacteria bacterium]
MRTGDSIAREMEFDFIFLMTTLALLVMGTIMIFSASYFVSKELCGSSIYLMKKHLAHLLIGTIFMVGIMKIDYRRFNSRPFILLLLVFAIGALIGCFIPGIGLTGGHAKRWVHISSFNFQASELVKVALIFYLASYLTKKGKRIEDFSYGILPALVIVGFCALLIFIEPDFGTAATIGVWAVAVMFIAGMRWKHLLFMFLAGLPLGVLMMILEPYRRARLLAFINPWEDMQGIGYQIIQSLVAFANGGFIGSGLGESTQKLFFLPAPHTDFILSVLGEELGFIGIGVVITLFGTWIWRGLSIATATNDSFGFYLVVASVCLIGLQAVINMGVAMSVFPTTGIALPFLSYGGSTLVTTMMISGIILSVSRRARL